MSNIPKLARDVRVRTEQFQVDSAIQKCSEEKRSGVGPQHNPATNPRLLPHDALLRFLAGTQRRTKGTNTILNFLSISSTEAKN